MYCERHFLKILNSKLFTTHTGDGVLMFFCALTGHKAETNFEHEYYSEAMVSNISHGGQDTHLLDRRAPHFSSSEAPASIVRGADK